MIFRIFLGWLIFVAVCLIRIYLKYEEFCEYIMCYSCQEMDSIDSPYDYIIVGLGSAGSVVARRLAEDEHAKVLVLEAGYETFLGTIPTMLPLLQKSSFDWQYTTTPQKYSCRALEDCSSNWPMGKVMGGTHMLNNMIYTRGHPNDYNQWFKHVKGYKYEEDILPYFLKAENTLEDGNLNKGTVVVSNISFVSNVANYVLAGISSMGLPILQDMIVTSEGFSKPKTTTLKGGRWTTADHLLNLNKQNVMIRRQVTVESVLLKDNFEAYGIRYLYLNDYYHAKAKRGIILSAGVIGSPKILMLSGIGPKEHLKSVDVEPKINLPVGDNLQDHVTTGLDLIVLDNITPSMSIKEMINLYSIYDYFVNGAGPWTSIGCDLIGFLHSDNSTSCDDRPELQFMVMQLGLSSDYGAFLNTLVGLKKDAWGRYFKHVIGNDVLSIIPVLLHPKSRGTVRLRDKNVYSKPLINPNYLKEQYDVDVLLKGVSFIKKLLETQAMKDIGASLNKNVFPGCEDYIFDTKDYWKCYLRHFTLTAYHPVGTCKMGKGRSSVVDFNFKVRGTNNLYVVDGSVLPTLTSGNINGAIIMLAERAADLIKYENYLNSCYCKIREIFIPKKVCDKLPIKIINKEVNNKKISKEKIKHFRRIIC